MEVIYRILWIMIGVVGGGLIIVIYILADIEALLRQDLKSLVELQFLTTRYALRGTKWDLYEDAEYGFMVSPKESAAPRGQAQSCTE